MINSSNQDSSNNKNEKQLDFKINKKGFIETQGVIEEALPSAAFKIVLENGHIILARLSGRMRMNRIMLLPGDKVKIEMSQYDLTKGRIIYRL